MQKMSGSLFAYKALKRLWSHQSWVVLYRSVESLKAKDDQSGFCYRRASLGDAEDIRAALPGELVGRFSEEVKASFIAARFQSNMACFVVEDRGRIIGGCWCPEIAATSQLAALSPEKGRLAEISRLYVSPDYRGKGVASALCEEVSRQMGAAGYHGLLSLVWYTRPASIRSHLKAGFMPVGEKNTWSVAGFRWTTFAPHFREDDVPGRGLT